MCPQVVDGIVAELIGLAFDHDVILSETVDAGDGTVAAPLPRVLTIMQTVLAAGKEGAHKVFKDATKPFTDTALANIKKARLFLAPRSLSSLF